VSARQAAPGEYVAVARLLADVFYEDPMYKWLVPNEKRRMKAITGLFETACHVLATADPAAVWTTDSFLGGAIWTPPGRPNPSIAMAWRVVADMMFGLRWGMFRQMEVESSLTPIKERHWYLNTIGVAASERGRGIGSALLAPIIARCDRDRLPIYLNTNTDDNVRFYRGRGFDVIRDVELDRGRMHLFEMRRPSQISASAYT
jgi:GNAT superfamily N-acetyltransferase